MTSETEDGFVELIEFIEDVCGYPTTHYNHSYLKRRIRSRMRRRGASDYEEYTDILREDQSEHVEILNSFSINVTEFFRNPDVWEEIRTVLRDLTDRKDEVQVWSAACADGREPYSVALLSISDPQIDADVVDVTATDINEEALEKAKNGIYYQSRTEDIAEQVSYLESPEKYLDVSESAFRVKDSVSDMVGFEKHDLIHGEKKSGFDLILCRNLLIYINSEYEQDLVETVYESLTTGGYLVIGKAETVPAGMSQQFDIVDATNRVYQKTD